MHKDRFGHTVTGANTEALESYECALEAFNIYRGDPVGLIDQALEAAPGFVMAHVLKAYMFGLATEPEGTREAARLLAVASELSCNERESSHVAALRPLIAGNWTAAATALDLHNLHYPHDLLALQAGHLMDFYRANSRNLRDRIARVLPLWSREMPGYSIVLGLYSFGLEETGAYAHAEDTGREALDRQPLDCWAHHAVAHVMEMQGRVQDGIGWMSEREPYWSGEDNLFKVHNWWHKALYHMDLGQVERAFDIYDRHIAPDLGGVALNLVDASALLWRLHLSGLAVGDRWQAVADGWDELADGKLYPYNDWHAVMAYLGANRGDRVDAIISAFDQASSQSETDTWAQAIGMPLVRGFSAFWHEDYATSAKTLHGARFIVNAFGGSNAQRDVIDWTLAEAGLRSGDSGIARGIANERLALKPHSGLNRDFLSRALAMGDGAV
ncbi:tetratricopeptide repeat protein [Acidihalobacter prosperus]|uniref:Tetratricopeptide repeat protein 38 n=1 Tax=Acidihalobacter prosperus TaxID=160660 RepID=A0A1A6C3J8_9GAMM|nr:tetratricopeptide repeat protein [Acidihalobacter prosperus]OBS09137.1 TPR repeat [Acidihalobacter prosperus]